eukprot:gnl/TRDRNA2_/TRDRNA2_134035_c0_seq1.p1 gnl/TRDRNA2_/TRDRNA2_134035_c0~~gnl/TRDRNA2_/TRDRNA2_134035_c0_seq1.p1  ORF type:complete len:388 (-),score=58.52 gnl/TRDRNA2_/TRDRNA2_134035_c0_seq1:42-1205(-)
MAKTVKTAVSTLAIEVVVDSSDSEVGRVRKPVAAVRRRQSDAGGDSRCSIDSHSSRAGAKKGPRSAAATGSSAELTATKRRLGAKQASQPKMGIAPICQGVQACTSGDDCHTELQWAVLRPGEVRPPPGQTARGSKRASTTASGAALPDRRVPHRPWRSATNTRSLALPATEPGGAMGNSSTVEAEVAAERAVKRFRKLKRGGDTAVPKKDSQTLSVPAGAAANPLAITLYEAEDLAVDKLKRFATTLLEDTLGGGARGLASAVAEAFVFAHGIEARPRLLALHAALRKNLAFRNAVVEAGTEGLPALAEQDPREWACQELKAKRAKWAQEAFDETKIPIGRVSVCPECGGRAVVECGQSSDFKMAKQYAHYSCMEERCGKVVHVKQ